MGRTSKANWNQRRHKYVLDWFHRRNSHNAWRVLGVPVVGKREIGLTPHTLIRLSAIITFVFTHVALADSPDVEAAFKDRAAHFAEKDWDCIYYLTTKPSVGEAAKNLERAIKLVVAQTSTQRVLNRCVPVSIGGGLFRIDLRDLNWRQEDWQEVAYKRNPYAIDKLPLVVRADWLLEELSDLVDSDSYFRLLFGGNKIPKTIDDVRKFFHIDDDQNLRVGMIAGESTVNTQGTRWLESRPAARGYYWQTFDSKKLDKDHDPIEHVDGNFKFDGSEIIVGMVKLWIGDEKHAGTWGTLQAYFLTNDKGELVQRAPVDLVSDATRFRGYDEIRNPGSCIQCHKTGLNLPTSNEFRKLVTNGVDVFAGNAKKDQLEAFHLSDLAGDFAAANNQFQTIVEYATGAKSADTAKSFKAAIDAYDAPLNLELTATELEVPVDAWVKAIATTGTLPARLASLTGGQKTDKGDTRGTIPRVAWEQVFRDAYYATHGGRPITKPAPEKPKDPVQEAPPAVVVEKPEPPAEKPAKPVVANNGWRMRLLLPPGSEAGESVAAMLTGDSKLGDFCREHGFEAITTDSGRFEEWRVLGYRQNEMTFVIVSPSGRVVMKQHSISKDPEKALAEFRDAIDGRESDGFEQDQNFNSGRRR